MITCHLLNKLPNTVALSVPYAPKMPDKLKGEEVLCDDLQRVFWRMRGMIQVEKSPCPSKLEMRFPITLRSGKG